MIREQEEEEYEEEEEEYEDEDENEKRGMLSFVFSFISNRMSGKFYTALQFLGSHA